MSNKIVSLYRTYLCQIKQLPQPYLRQFFRIKASDDIRALVRAQCKDLYCSKLKRINQSWRRIEAANNGSAQAFEHILDLAYGRKGKLKWELMEPILSDPNAAVPPQIIPSVEKSRPPVYSPEMKALLLSSYSRKKPLVSKSLAFPPILPSRANPSSEDARLLGPFSKRREVNIRWRYFTREWKKVLPPLQVVIKDHTSDTQHEGVSQHELVERGVRGMGMQGYGIFEDVRTVAGPIVAPHPVTRKERLIRMDDADLAIEYRHPSRWLRRRYRGLLGRLPILTYSSSKREDGKYSVSLSPAAMALSLRFDPSQHSDIGSIADLKWLEYARGTKGKRNAEG